MIPHMMVSMLSFLGEQISLWLSGSHFPFLALSQHLYKSFSLACNLASRKDRPSCRASTAAAAAASTPATLCRRTTSQLNRCHRCSNALPWWSTYARSMLLMLVVLLIQLLLPPGCCPPFLCATAEAEYSDTVHCCYRCRLYEGANEDKQC